MWGFKMTSLGLMNSMNRLELADALLEKHQEFAELIADLTEAQFLQAPENKWNAGQQLDHLYRSIRPLALAYRLPSIVPALLFGKSKAGSGSYKQLVQRYQAKLDAGAKATAAYQPQAIPYSVRRKASSALLDNASITANKIRSRTEQQLDEYRLPHPLIGKVSFREMGYFTIYHVGHHLELTKKYAGL